MEDNIKQRLTLEDYLMMFVVASIPLLLLGDVYYETFVLR